jgi:superfamily II DNA or RNA helicase
MKLESFSLKDLHHMVLALRRDRHPQGTGKSAKSLDRPGLKRALGMLKRGEAAALLVVKLDRLTRSGEEFGKGNDFAQKITYKVTGTKPADLIQSFRNSYFPRVAVSANLIATGTDIKPVEIVVFMRSVKSRVLFEQMKGRGVRARPSRVGLVSLFCSSWPLRLVAPPPAGSCHSHDGRRDNADAGRR